MPHELQDLLPALPNDPAHWALVISVLSLMTSLALGGAALAWNIHTWRKDRRPQVQVFINLIDPDESAGRSDWTVEVLVALLNTYPVLVDSIKLLASHRRTDPVNVRSTLKPGEPPAVACFPLSELKAHRIDVLEPFKAYVILGAPHPPISSRKLRVLPLRPPTLLESLEQDIEGRGTDYRMMSLDFYAAAALPPLEDAPEGIF